MTPYMKVRTISETKGRRQDGFVSSWNPFVAAFVKGNEMLPSKSGVPITITSKRSFGKDSISMSHGGVIVSAQLDARITDGYVYSSRSHPDILLLDHVLDAIIYRRMPEWIHGFRSFFSVVAVAFVIIAAVTLAISATSVGAGSARTKAWTTSRSRYADSFCFPIVVMACGIEETTQVLVSATPHIKLGEGRTQVVYYELTNIKLYVPVFTLHTDREHSNQIE